MSEFIEKLQSNWDDFIFFLPAVFSLIYVIVGGILIFVVFRIVFHKKKKDVDKK